MRRKTIPLKYPCIFTNLQCRTDVDPWVKARFEEEGHKAPFGDLRKTWREEHCRTLNPYGSEDCPYTLTECGAAFMEAIDETWSRHPRRFMGMFHSVARIRGAIRADAAQGSRHHRGLRSGDAAGPGGQVRQPAVPLSARQERPSPPPGDRDDAPRGREEPVRGPDRGPVRLGTLFGSLDFGSRPSPRGRDEGEASTE